MPSVHLKLGQLASRGGSIFDTRADDNLENRWLKFWVVLIVMTVHYSCIACIRRYSIPYVCKVLQPHSRCLRVISNL